MFHLASLPLSASGIFHNHLNYHPYKIVTRYTRVAGQWVVQSWRPEVLQLFVMELQPVSQRYLDYNIHHHSPKTQHILMNCRMPGQWLCLIWQVVKFS